MADLLLVNAQAVTMDKSMPRASSILIRNGIISEVSSKPNFESVPDGDTPVIDCKGRTILPGFVDVHCHILPYAESFVSANLSPRDGVRSILDLQQKIQDFCSGREAGTWVRGKGYDEFSLTERRHPTRWDIDAAAPRHPVKLTHRSGHAHVLNSLALELVGVTAETEDPPGGLIDRDIRTGEPTGLLYGMGGYLARHVPLLEKQQIETALMRVNEKLLSYGITSVCDVSNYNGACQWEQFRQVKMRHIFEPRITMALGWSGFRRLEKQPLQQWVDENDLKMAGVKIIVDETTGTLYPSAQSLKRKVAWAHRVGAQVMIHAIEETAIEAACDAIEYALKLVPRADHRHRIEHASVCPPALMDRIKRLGIIVVTQPCFIYYHGHRYLETVPAKQQRHLYATGGMNRNGIIVCSSSDFPITDPNPFVGIGASVTRSSEAGERLCEEERINLLEAINMYTTAPAIATFQEGAKGSLTRGKLADLVVLDGNPFYCDQEQIKNLQVQMTIIGGNVVWERSHKITGSRRSHGST